MPTSDDSSMERTTSIWRLWLRRIAMVLVVLLGAGALYEQAGKWRDNRRFPAKGSLVDIGEGRRMYLDCRGSGSPTVILEAGHWNWSPSWTLVQPAVATFTRACAYDRAGLGLSDKGPKPRTAGAVSSDLHLLLERAGILPPYVLVGHSAGGMYQRVFLAASPQQVAGIVLIDSPEPLDDGDRLAIKTAPNDRQIAAAFTAMTHVGLFRLLVQALRLPIGPPRFQEYPEEARTRMLWGMTRMARAINDEWDLYSDAYVTVPDRPLGALPMVVISALGYYADVKDKEDWLQRQKKLSSLSTQAHHIVLQDMDHFLPFWRPEVVVDAIREVVQTANRKSAAPAPVQ
jgi:pimeloyl-ACP methyl ester carboxylesterase